MLLCLDVVVVFKTIGSQHLLHLLVWTGGDLVNHRPGEGDLCLVLQIVEEGSRYESISHPLLCVCEDACLHLITIVGTVVHRLDGE